MNSPSDLDVIVGRARRSMERLVAAVQTSGAPADELIIAVESIGRLVDAARVRAAERVVHPSIADELGFASPISALATLAGVSESSARSRLRVAEEVRVDRSLTGAEVPPRRAILAEAIDSGAVAIDAAAVICRELAAIEPRVDAESLTAAESVMVRLARGESVEGDQLASASATQLVAEVRQIASAIDPDGARPREERAVRRRSFQIDAADEDGLVPVSGRVMPEIGGLIAGMVEAHRRSPRFQDLSQSDELDRFLGDARTPAQRRHDAFAEIVVAAAQHEGSPRLDGAPVTVLVTVSAVDLASDGPAFDGLASDGLDGDPIGVMSGSTVPVSRARVLQFIDAGGFRPVRLDAAGAVVSIGSQQRCFAPNQRLGIAARDGQRCSAPGCTSPHYTLQAHHVVPYRDGGPTAVDNGILLCYWHHRRVDDGPWEYRMIDGVPHVRGPGVREWTRTRPPARAAA